jgi:hypothetical protein
MVVFKEGQAWFLRMAMTCFGPCPTRRGAIGAAIEAARLAEQAGKSARVREQTALFEWKTHWPKQARPRRRVRPRRR